MLHHTMTQNKVQSMGHNTKFWVREQKYEVLYENVYMHHVRVFAEKNNTSKIHVVYYLKFNFDLTPVCS